MFRVDFMCEDKNLHKALRALIGIANAPGPQAKPVENAIKKNGKLTAETNGTQQEMFQVWLRKNKLTEINAGQIRLFLQSIGGSANSYANLLRKSIQAGILKKTGKGTLSKYAVLTPKSK